MRYAIIAAPLAGGMRSIMSCAFVNGAHPMELPLWLSDRIANGEAIDGERVIRLPRAADKLLPYQAETRYGVKVPR